MKFMKKVKQDYFKMARLFLDKLKKHVEHNGHVCYGTIVYGLEKAIKGTEGDIINIDNLLQEMREDDIEVSDSILYKLQEQIKEIK